MAKKTKEVVQQQEENQPNVQNEGAQNEDAQNEDAQNEGIKEVPLTEEQVLLQAAIDTGTPEAIEALQGNGHTTEKLSMLITVYLSLLGVLGEESPATVNAYNNLVGYTPDKVKKAKKEKGEKEPKFNEGKEVRKIFDSETLDDEGKLAALKTLQNDGRVSDELKVAITTYITLLGIADIPEQAIQLAYDALIGWGKKGKAKSTGERGPLQRSAPHIIELDGVDYSNLSAALRAAGYDNKVLDSEDGTKAQSWNTAWSKVSSQFKKGDVAEYEGNTFTRIWTTEPVEKESAE